MAQIPIYDMGTCAVTSSSVNWAGQLTTPIKDQGACGSCWAFAAVEQVESDIMRTFGSSYTYELSEEQLLDCDGTPQYANDGCNGGNPYYAFDYLKTHYIEENTNYPYTSGSNTARKTCNYDANKGVAGLTSFSQLPRDETCMAQYIQQNGPLSAAVYANNWQYYNPSQPGGSIMTAAACGHGFINHAVQIVGVSIPGGYWIIRNTWGTSWGQQGYIWLEYGKNACNITVQMSTMFTTPFLYTSPTAPSRAPISSVNPSVVPTRAPTKVPSLSPTASPTVAATTQVPSVSPTVSPTVLATTKVPSLSPTVSPTVIPTTKVPSASPTMNPTVSPTVSPTTAIPTPNPTLAPTLPAGVTANPTVTQSSSPSRRPTAVPTAVPSAVPTTPPITGSQSPTVVGPTAAPSNSVPPVSSSPSVSPTITTPTASDVPTNAPVTILTDSPSFFVAAPTAVPTTNNNNGTSSSSTSSSSAPFSVVGGVAGLIGIIVAVLVGAIIVAWLVWFYHHKKSSSSGPAMGSSATGTAVSRNPMVSEDMLL
jgi:hypothetical protein